MNKFLLITLVSTLVLAACKDEDDAITTKLDCGDAGQFEITFKDESATLTMGDGDHELTAVPAGSGQKYSNNSIEAWENDGEVLITYLDTSAPSLTCKVAQ